MTKKEFFEHLEKYPDEYEIVFDNAHNDQTLRVIGFQTLLADEETVFVTLSENQ